MRQAIAALAGLVVGAMAGVGATLAVQDDDNGPRILCETDASRIAQAYQESGTDLQLLINCQEASAGEHPLENATLAPEYRCFLGVQQASSPYNLDCTPMPGPPR